MPNEGVLGLERPLVSDNRTIRVSVGINSGVPPRKFWDDIEQTASRVIKEQVGGVKSVHLTILESPTFERRSTIENSAIYIQEYDVKMNSEVVSEVDIRSVENAVLASIKEVLEVPTTGTFNEVL